MTFDDKGLIIAGPIWLLYRYSAPIGADTYYKMKLDKLEINVPGTPLMPK
jgi:hypothetical protein